jgi:hypothetical protein
MFVERHDESRAAYTLIKVSTTVVSSLKTQGLISFLIPINLPRINLAFVPNVATPVFISISSDCCSLIRCDYIGGHRLRLLVYHLSSMTSLYRSLNTMKQTMPLLHTLYGSVADLMTQA